MTLKDIDKLTLADLQAIAKRVGNVAHELAEGLQQLQKLSSLAGTVAQPAAPILHPLASTRGPAAPTPPASAIPLSQEQQDYLDASRLNGERAALLAQFKNSRAAESDEPDPDEVDA